MFDKVSEEEISLVDHEELAKTIDATSSMAGSSPFQWEHCNNQNNLPQNHYLRKYHPH